MWHFRVCPVIEPLQSISQTWDNTNVLSEKTSIYRREWQAPSLIFSKWLNWPGIQVFYLHALPPTHHSPSLQVLRARFNGNTYFGAVAEFLPRWKFCIRLPNVSSKGEYLSSAPGTNIRYETCCYESGNLAIPSWDKARRTRFLCDQTIIVLGLNYLHPGFVYLANK